MKKRVIVYGPIVTVLMVAALIAYAQPQVAAQARKADECKSFYDKSLHSTGEGMRYWYEREDGFMQITGIPYKDLGLSLIHI